MAEDEEVRDFVSLELLKQMSGAGVGAEVEAEAWMLELAILVSRRPQEKSQKIVREEGEPKTESGVPSFLELDNGKLKNALLAKAFLV